MGVTQNEARKYTVEEWRARAVELFGEDELAWQFRCPMCSHVQSPESLRKYKEQGATPSSAYQECAGRFSGGERLLALDGNPDGKGEGCDYAAYGLFRFGDFVGDTPVFPFANGEES